jgi:sec-independent protein translocase protein TatB
MFDLTSTKLMILAVVALVVVGPKDFPVLLRTIGRYLGVLKRHAEEFRTQFDQALRESELAEMKAQVDKMSRDIETSVREADRALASTASDAGSAMDASFSGTKPAGGGASPPAEPASAVPPPPPVTPAAPFHDPIAASLPLPDAAPLEPVPVLAEPAGKPPLERTGT